MSGNSPNALKGYMGNVNLKRENVKIKYTKFQIQEIAKCRNDPIYFIQNYIKIVNVDKGFIPFKLYDFQIEIIKCILENRFVICKLPRQSGKSITVASMLLWYALFNPEFNIAILAHKAEQSRVILDRIQRSYEALPPWLQQGIGYWNKGSLELENGSKIKAAATSAGSIRGDSFNLIYLDEFAFVDGNLQASFFASVFPTISSGETTKVLITSTPNGLDLFYKLWSDSENGKNSYARVEINWWDVPGRDEAWKKKTIDNTSEEQFRQEFQCVDPSTIIEILDTHTNVCHKMSIKNFYEFCL